MKKIGLTVLAVILALGLLGVGYAAWQETLTINGNAIAAKWDVYFDNAGATAALGNTPNTQHEPIPGTDAFLSTSGAPGDTLEVTIENAYPGLDVTVYYDVSTKSTIPVTFVPKTANKGTLPDGCTVSNFVPAGPIGGTSGGLDTSEGNFVVHFPSSLNLDNFPSEGQYTFTVTLQAQQATP